MESPQFQDIAVTTGCGAVAGGFWALNQKMTRAQVLINVIGASVFAGTIPPVLMVELGLKPVWSAFLGVACGLSVPAITLGIQSATERFVKKKSDDLGGPTP